MTQFDHEKLDVYQLAIDFVSRANAIIGDTPRGHGPLTDQLMRAATSIPLNIADGSGEFSGAEKGRFYRMAKRSATECAAILDVFGRLELAERTALCNGRELLLSIVRMLVKLVRAVS